MQDLSVQFKEEALKTENRPIEIYDFYLGSQGSCDAETYYFTSDNKKTRFWNIDGVLKEYLPLSLKRSAIPATSQLEIEAVTGELDNVDRLWSGFLNTIDLRGKRVVMRKVFLDLLTDPVHAKVMFDGVINAVAELTETSVKLECKSKLKSLSVETGRMQQLYCSYIFGDEFCSFNVAGTRLTGQIVGAGSGTGFIIDPARTEADDYWNDGILYYTSGLNLGLKRKIADFVSADHKVILDYTLPHAPVAGDTYSIERGCDKSFDVCKNRFANQANFGGFKHIPQLINPMTKEE